MFAAEANAGAIDQRGSSIASSWSISGDTGCSSCGDNSRAVLVRVGQALAEAFPLEAVPFLAAIERVISAVDEVVKDNIRLLAVFEGFKCVLLAVLAGLLGRSVVAVPVFVGNLE